MQLVQQTENWDCGAACLAMITGKSLEEVKADLSPRSEDFEFKGVYAMETLQYLYKENFVCTIYENPDMLDISGDYRINIENGFIHLLQKKDVLHHIDLGLDAIIVVPSLTTENVLHQIVIHKGIIFDPSTIKQYTWSQVQEFLYGDRWEDFTAAFLIKSRIETN